MPIVPVIIILSNSRGRCLIATSGLCKSIIQRDLSPLRHCLTDVTAKVRPNMIYGHSEMRQGLRFVCFVVGNLLEEREAPIYRPTCWFLPGQRTKDPGSRARESDGVSRDSMWQSRACEGRVLPWSASDGFHSTTVSILHIKHHDALVRRFKVWKCAAFRPR